MTDPLAASYSELSTLCEQAARTRDLHEPGKTLGNVDPNTLVGIALWYMNSATQVNFSGGPTSRNRDVTDEMVAVAAAAIAKKSPPAIEREATYLFALDVAKQFAESMIRKRTTSLNFSSGEFAPDCARACKAAGIGDELVKSVTGFNDLFGRTKINIDPATKAVFYRESGYDKDGQDITSQVSLIAREFADFVSNRGQQADVPGRRG